MLVCEIIANSESDLKGFTSARRIDLIESIGLCIGSSSGRRQLIKVILLVIERCRAHIIAQREQQILLASALQGQIYNVNR